MNEFLDIRQCEFSWNVSKTYAMNMLTRRISEFGNHGKIATKFSNVPTLKKIDTKNVVDYLKMALATLNVQHGMLLSLTHVCPSDTDPALLSRIERSLDKDQKQTALTKKIWKKYQQALKNWTLQTRHSEVLSFGADTSRVCEFLDRVAD